MSVNESFYMNSMGTKNASQNSLGDAQSLLSNSNVCLVPVCSGIVRRQLVAIVQNGQIF
jgi:hypothetical protein